MKNKTRRIYKIALTVLAALILSVVGLAVTVGAEGAERVDTDTAYINLERYDTYIIYPDGYIIGYDDLVPFSGRYVFTGEASEDIKFKSYDEPVTYDVVLHNVDATADTWYGMMGVDPNVTLNLTVYGDNSVFGYNHPGISIGEQKDGNAPIVNVTMTEGSRVTFGSNYYETETCIAEGITVNLLNGESSIDMSVEGWQNNSNIVFSNGEYFSHKMQYVYVDDDTCRYECADCSVISALEYEHWIVCGSYAEDHPEYATKHSVFCYECRHEFSTGDHAFEYKATENAHHLVCYMCGYKTESEEHVTDEDGCTVCGSKYSYKLEIDGETTYIFSTKVLAELLKDGGKVTLLNDIYEDFAYTLQISENTEIDLAGKNIDNVSLSVNLDATLIISDSVGGGGWTGGSMSPSYLNGTLKLDGINLNNGNINVYETGALYVSDVRCASDFKLRLFDSPLYIDGLVCDGTFQIILLSYKEDISVELSNLTLARLEFVSGLSEDVNVNMLLPEGYVFAGEQGILDGSGTEVCGVTSIVEHTIHNSDKMQQSSESHWISCTCGHAENPVLEPHSLGDDGLCEECGAQILAVITADGVSKYYMNLIDAFLESNNHNESTVTLLGDFRDDGYRDVDIRNKVVFDLNGYTYNTGGRLRIFSSLTITDSSEEKTGKMHGSGDISYIMEFYKDTQVTINGGEFFGLIYGAIYSEGTATITVNDGRFIGKEKFRLNNGTTAVINGGVFECSVSVFDLTWATNVKYEIKGGIFINSCVFDMEDDDYIVLEDVLLKDGDCELCFVSSAGNILTAEELSKTYEGEIYVFHKNSNGWANDKAHGRYCVDCDEYSDGIAHSEGMYEPTADGSAHYVVCIHCYWTIRTEEHKGGEATCTERAECLYCEELYGEEPKGHVHDNACDSLCNVCEDEREVPDHVYDNACDSLCNVCEDEREVPDHVYDNACDSLCNVCEDEREVPDHVYDNGACSSCGVPDPNAQGSSSGSSDIEPNNGQGGEDGSGGSDTDDGGIGGVGITLITVGSALLVGGGLAGFRFFRKSKFSCD